MMNFSSNRRVPLVLLFVKACVIGVTDAFLSSCQLYTTNSFVSHDIFSPKNFPTLQKKAYRAANICNCKMVAVPPNTKLSKAEQSELNLRLWEAAKNGETAQLESLVAAGANVNHWDPELLQSTAIQWAATNGHADTIKKLVELGASVGPTNQFGWSALHHAANWGYEDCVRVLVEMGADINAMSETGKTAVDAAAFKGFSNIVDFLREKAKNDALGVTGVRGMLGSTRTSNVPIAGFDPNNVPDRRRVTEGFSVWKDSWGKRPGR